LLVKKKDGSFRMCVDYCGLNWFTIKNQYPLPLISRLLDQLNYAKMYTKIYLHGTYNLVHIRKDDEWKTTFRTRYGHFQHIMNNVFCGYLDDFMVCYINEILIFSKNMKDHECHVCLDLEKFQDVGFYAKFEKW
jgi:hypothetical protein